MVDVHMTTQSKAIEEQVSKIENQKKKNKTTID